VISGKKGSGKTELAKFMAYVYHEKLPRNRVIVFSGIKDLYADLPWAIKVDLKEEEQEKSRAGYSGIPDASEFRDSLVIFDDTEKMPNVKIEKMLYQLVNVLAQNGRNFGTNVICILHQVNKGLQSTTLLREADTFIIFPRSYDMNTFNTLINHLGFSKEDAQALYAFQDEMGPINPQQSLIFVRWNDHKNSFKNRNLAHHCVLQIYKLRLTLSLGRLMT
jgi:energy-coupling factor transporter ATP-binding protein EcfA2